MTLYYADPSALIRAYFVDEDDHESLRRMVFEGNDPIVTSELTRLEFASATAAANRAKRIADPGLVLDMFDADCGDDGVITMLRLDPARSPSHWRGGWSPNIHCDRSTRSISPWC